MRRAAARGAAAIALFAGGAAAAQPAPGAGPVPACVLLHEADGQPRAGVDAGYVFFENTPGTGDLSAYRVEVSGQYVTPSGLGGYAALPISHGSLDAGMIDVSDTSIGNVEVGGVYLAPVQPGVSVAAHAGATLPTAPEIDEMDFDGFGNALGVYVSLRDLVRHIPEAAYLVGGLAVLVRQGDLFFRGDGGVDVPVHNGGMGDTDDLPKLGHVDLAGGYAGRDAALMGELVNVINLEFESDDDVISFAGVTVRYTAVRVQPSLSIMTPLDESLRDQIEFVLLAGAQAQLP